MNGHSRNVVVGLAWIALVVVRSARAGAAPVVTRLSPANGEVGHVVTLQGTDLAGAVIEVTFGRAPALEAHNPGGSDDVIRLLIPNKVDPRDPDTVTVTVRVDGVEAVAIPGPLQFTYSIPQPLPSITDITTGDPLRPRTVFQGQPFVLTLTGSNFLMARRVPQRCIALGGEVLESEFLAYPPTDTSVSFSFPGLQVPGDYEFMIAFSDGSGASFRAPDFVERRPVFGFPPTIQSVSASSSPQQSALCDFAKIVEGYLCTFGIVAAKADPGIFIGGTFTHVDIQARVTDPDSTPEQSNVFLVTATFIHPETHNEVSLVLFDDGSTSRFPVLQRSYLPEDCTVDEYGCDCRTKSYAVVSNDAVTRDDLYTRTIALVDPRTPSLALLQDCILEQYRETLLVFAVGTTLDFKIEAVDRQGNFSSWPLRPTAQVGTGSFSCTGDACGCCLLTSTDPSAECHGRPGMPSLDFPSGVCLSLF